MKIEWPENERGRLPSTTTPQDLDVNLNTSGNFNDTNLNKKSLSLNVRSAKGLEIVKRLIAVSDIVIENFSSRVLQKWGLGYEELRKIKPDIVYVSMSGYGHIGRHHHYTTFGPVAQAVSGLTYLSGLPDRVGLDDGLRPDVDLCRPAKPRLVWLGSGHSRSGWPMTSQRPFCWVSTVRQNPR